MLPVVQGQAFRLVCALVPQLQDLQKRFSILGLFQFLSGQLLREIFGRQSLVGNIAVKEGDKAVLVGELMGCLR